MICVFIMTGTPECSTESGSMEKPGIEPATPGLQGIALIHYTTGTSQNLVKKTLLLRVILHFGILHSSLLKSEIISIWHGIALN